VIDAGRAEEHRDQRQLSRLHARPGQGRRVTRQGKRNLGFLKVDKRHDGRGNPYFWIGFERAAMMDTPAEGTDLARSAARYVSVTPLRLDRTDEAFSEALTTTLEVTRSVIPAKAGIQYAAASRFQSQVSGYWIIRFRG
jgi:hypothetical protein